MKALVPLTKFDMDTLLQLLGQYASSDMPTYVCPLEVKDERLIFDLKWWINAIYLSDIYIPLLPGKEAQARTLADQLWQMMIGKVALPPTLSSELLSCVDTSKPTSPELLQQMADIVKKLQAG